MERVKGIEPSSQAWEAHILPLNHTRSRGRFLSGVFAGRNCGLDSVFNLLLQLADAGLNGGSCKLLCSGDSKSFAAE